MQKTQRLDYLQQIPLFKPWPPENIKQMNSCFCQQKYRVGDVIYDIDSSPDLFYILISGNMVMETEIRIDEKNRFPVGVDSWEVHTTKRKIKYEVKELELNEVFGHEELIEVVRWQQNGE